MDNESGWPTGRVGAGGSAVAAVVVPLANYRALAKLECAQARLPELRRSASSE